MISKHLRRLVLFTFGLVVASAFFVGAHVNAQDVVPDQPNPAEKAKKSESKPRIQTEQILSPVATGGPDAYGYVWDDGLAYSWINIETPDAEVSFPSNDDAVSTAKALGFSFPFYEKNYSSVYVSTNGLLTFVLDNDSDSPSNQLLPFIEQPQAVIAPFWDDLAVGSGAKVYAKQYSATQFVVSFVDVTRLGSTSTLSFQVILDSDGTIKFQYQNLTGTLDKATVGIEDHDGVVGLTYLHNSDMSGLVNKAVTFMRPSNTDHRPKALPIYQSAFTVSGLLDLDITITNAGEVSQSFNLNLQNSNISWQVQLFDVNDALVSQTPILNKGENYQVTAKFVAPEDAEVGSSTTVELDIVSTVDTNETWTVEMQSTVPASFVQALKDSGDIDLRAVSKFGQRKITVFPLYTGSSMGVQSLSESTFMTYWERNGDRVEGGQIVTWTDIEQAVVDDFGTDYLYATKLTDNSILASTEYNVFATEPVSAITPDGNVGIVWVQRTDRRSDNKSQYNIYMMVLDADDTTQFVEPPFSVTQNNNWVGIDDINIPRYKNPRITSTPNSIFFVSWTDERLQPDGTESNIGIAAFQSVGNPGNPIIAAQKYTDLTSDADNTLYQFSMVHGLANNHIILGYSSFDFATNIFTPGYAVLNASGGTESAPVLLSGVEGQYPVFSQIANGSIIYAWTKTVTENDAVTSSQIAYVLINPVTYLASAHLELTTPDGLQGDYVSITPDENGNAVFTWADKDIERKLYYALISSSGSLDTPPIAYYEIESGKALLVNQSGRGNAFYIHRFGVYVPLIFKNN
jgi:hypothetical protein